MRSALEYWDIIAEELEQRLGYGPLKGWSKKQFEDFALRLEYDLTKICEEDIKKRKLLGTNYSISVDTLKRLFVNKNSKGKVTTKNMFAIFLGYDDLEDFKLKRMPIPLHSPQLLDTANSLTGKWNFSIGLYKGRFLNIGIVVVIIVGGVLLFYSGDRIDDGDSKNSPQYNITTDDGPVIIESEATINYIDSNWDSLYNISK